MNNSQKLFLAAYPYQNDVLALPVENLDRAAQYYSNAFGMREEERFRTPIPTVVLERDGTRIGFAITGEDPSQDGAAILVSDIAAAKKLLRDQGIAVGDERTDERDGQRFSVFFVIAPDGLCFYFHQLID